MERAFLGEDALEVLRGILEHSRLPITVADLDGRLEIFNRAAEAFSGYRREEVLRRPVDELFLDPKRVSEVLDAVKRAGSLQDVIGNLRRKDGSILPISMSLTLLHDVLGRPAGILAVTQDVSARLEMERQLQETREEAEFFVDLMCHDLRNLDQTVLGYLGFLLEGGAGPLSGDVRRKVETAWQESYLLRQFLWLVQLLAGRETEEGLEFVPVSLGEAARAGLERVRERVDWSLQATLVVRSDPTVASMEVLPEMVAGLVYYAAVNAQEGGELKVTADRRGGVGLLRVEAESQVPLRRNLTDWQDLAGLDEATAAGALAAMFARLCSGRVTARKRKGRWRLAMHLPLWSGEDRAGGREEPP